MKERFLPPQEYTYKLPDYTWIEPLSNFLGEPTYSSLKDSVSDPRHVVIQYEILRAEEYRRNLHLDRETVSVIVSKDTSGAHHFSLSVYVEVDATNLRFPHVTRFIINHEQQSIDFFCFHEDLLEQYLLSVYKTGEIKKSSAIV